MSRSIGKPTPAQMAPILDRIEQALEAASHAIAPLIRGAVANVDYKAGDNPVTAADHLANSVLREILPRGEEGWLSEESVDDLTRLARARVWVVDPVDGTREFVARVPEWCISVAFVEDGRSVAGGICNPCTNEVFLGAVGLGVSRNGQTVRANPRSTISGAVVLASRSEVNRGEWTALTAAPFCVRPMGSVAYKLALVAVGSADATWSHNPKNEWDVAAGVALVEAAGGYVRTTGGQPLTFNRRCTQLPGIVACGPGLSREFGKYVKRSEFGSGTRQRTG